MARARKKPSSHASELLALVAFALAALTAISLLSFDPLDRSFFAVPSADRDATHNLVGAAGANLAHGLLASIGVFAYLLPPLLVIIGVRRLRGSKRLAASHVVGLTILWLASSALLALSVGEVTYLTNDGAQDLDVEFPAAGLVGQIAAGALHDWLGPIGTLIVLLTAVSASLVLATPLSFAQAMDSSLRTTATSSKRLRATVKKLRTRSSRWLERQRKKLDKHRKDRVRIAADRNAAAERERERAAAEGKRREAARLAAERATRVAARRTPSPDSPLRPEPADTPAAARMTPQSVGLAPTPHFPMDSEEARVSDLAAEASAAMQRARTDTERPADDSRVETDSGFELPPLSILEHLENEHVVTEQELVEQAQVLVSKLKEFSVDGTVQAIHPGPVVTTFEYRPEPGVKYSKIVGLGEDLCLATKAEGIRIDRIRGKSAVGIEIPTTDRETIGLRDLLESVPFKSSTSKLTMAIGKDIHGEPFVTDLRKMPHLLVAGATGAGKSVGVNCMLVSILYSATPEQVRFIMVDPKRIELGIYDGIPHLLVPVVTDARKASNALRWAVSEMENRYKRLAMLGVRSLEQFNKTVVGPEAQRLGATMTPEELEPLPYIVIIIDELADLMMVAASDVEDSISRLAAMARAVGIHLILATQRPSVDVITGVIKANFPSRISFRVSSRVDSRTILDSNGAEMLLGKGDMLFMPPGSARLVRVHGGFISDGEVQRLVSFLKNQGEPEYNEKVLNHSDETREDVAGDGDEMYDEAIRVVMETGQASVSMLQRRLRLGYGRAARLVDVMEQSGIVGPSQGAKGREILIDRESYLNQLANAE